MTFTCRTEILLQLNKVKCWPLCSYYTILLHWTFVSATRKNRIVQHRIIEPHCLCAMHRTVLGDTVCAKIQKHSRKRLYECKQLETTQCRLANRPRQPLMTPTLHNVVSKEALLAALSMGKGEGKGIQKMPKWPLFAWEMYRTVRAREERGGYRPSWRWFWATSEQCSMTRSGSRLGYFPGGSSAVFTQALSWSDERDFSECQFRKSRD